MNKVFLSFLFIGSTVVFFSMSSLVHASNSTNLNPVLAQSTPSKGYQLTVPFPGQSDRVSGPRAYILNLYNFGLYAGGILAVLIIVIGGIKWTISEAIPQKENALDMIRSSLLGLALLLAAFVILQLINPIFNDLPEPGLAPAPSISCNTPTKECDPGTIKSTDETGGGGNIWRCNSQCKWERTVIPGA